MGGLPAHFRDMQTEAGMEGGASQGQMKIFLLATFTRDGLTTCTREFRTRLFP